MDRSSNASSSKIPMDTPYATGEGLTGTVRKPKF